MVGALRLEPFPQQILIVQPLCEFVGPAEAVQKNHPGLGAFDVLRDA